MLPDIQGLPGPEREAAAGDRDHLARAGDGAAEVARHVVGALVVVLVVAALGGEARHPALQIAEDGRISVFLDDEARRGVLEEHGAEADVDAGGGDDARDLARDVHETSAARADLERALDDGGHRAILAAFGAGALRDVDDQAPARPLLEPDADAGGERRARGLVSACGLVSA